MDSYGFLWVSTLSGVYRFDGTSFVIQHFDQAITEPFTHIAENSNRDLLFATNHRTISKLDRLTGKLSYIQLLETKLHAIASSSKGYTYLVGTNTIYSVEENFIVSKIELGGERSGLSSISATSQFRESKIYVAFGSGIYELDFEFDQRRPSVRLLIQLQLEPGESISAITRLQEGVILAGTTAGSLLSIQSNTTKRMEKRRISLASVSAITDIVESSEWVWVASHTGLTRLNKELSNLNAFQVNNSALTNNHVIDLYAHEDTLFVGNYQGMNILKENVAFSTFNQKNSLVDNEIMDLADCANGNIYVATYNGVYKRESGMLVHDKVYPKLTDNLEDQRFMNLSCQHDRLIVGSRSDGLLFADVDAKSFHNPPETSNLQITQLIEAKDRSVWFSTFANGVFQYKKGNIYRYELDNNSEKGAHTPVYAMTEDSNGAIYATTDTGVYRHASDDQVFRKLRISTEARILSILVDESETIWLGLQNKGLTRVRALTSGEPSEVFEVFSKSEYSGISVYSIERDGNSNIWASSSDGLFKYNETNSSYKRFDKSDGLQGSGFNFSASHIDRRGTIYFGGSNGYSIYNPEFELISGSEPKVYLSGIGIAGQETRTNFPIYLLEEIHLSYKDHSISFGFSVMDFLSPTDNQYRYRLEGFDPEWIEAGSRNFTTYTNLPAGEYTFRVQGANSMGIWNRDGISLLITKEAAPWFRWWAWLGYTILFLTLAWFAKRYITQGMIAKQSSRRVQEVNAAADQAIDELQEQLDYQRELIGAARSHSLQTLEFVQELIESQGTYRLGDRMATLSAVERNIAYQADELLVDFYQVTEELIQAALPHATVSSESITTINRVQIRHIAVDLAVPLAIVLCEYLEHAFTKSFVKESLANYLEVRLIKSPEQGSSEAALSFNLSDSGSCAIDAGEPEDSNLEFALITLICETYGWSLEHHDGKSSQLDILIPGIRID